MTYKPVSPRSFSNDPASGPSLETYVETRFNLLVDFINEKFAAQDVSMRAFVATAQSLAHAQAETIKVAQIAADLRYQQRFEAQSDALTAAFLAQQTAMKTALEAAEKAVQAALAAQERAVLKAELASDKRFESVNEFRKTLADQQVTFMPKAEASVVTSSQNTKIQDLKDEVSRLVNERVGIKGGWGYAVGVVGLLLALLGLWRAFSGR